MPGVPAGVDPDDISWDAVSFKIRPSTAELFANRNLQLEEQGVVGEYFALIDVLESECE
jgi:hypothetical protein